jgi:mannose-6-phosphate isomerase-like protein (cupin superfamily)
MAAVKKIIRANQVKPIVSTDGIYESRMILDDIVAGEHTVQINHGTVKPGGALAGGTHEKTELYFIISGKGKLRLDDDIYAVEQGCLVIIPGGCFHALSNASDTEELTILTLWMNAEDNEMYTYRMKLWGKSFKTIDED